MKRTVTLTREIEFDVVVEGHQGDDGQGFEYTIEDPTIMPLEEWGLTDPDMHLGKGWTVEVELTNGEVDEAIALAVAS